MRGNVFLGYLVLALALVLVVGASVELLVRTSPRPDRLAGLRPCRLIVGGPTPVWACARPAPHAWALQGGGLVDLGPLTGATPVPQR